ncbi:hypothetical protein [Streptomyces caatingaensis]|uniref:Lipoprotein n=1 Tax=Streptomyces caatingaensis TaxID=1678637 RepID=A0A0K9XJ32_9ACTN|nr:hypothetical protein [Streptomyces caatingaensis]KNB53404.1 hypothetical protein AC230_01620 [Streptomyces caatingaensis]
MHISRSRAAAAAACGAALVLASVSGAEAAAPRQAPPAGTIAAAQGGGYGKPSAAELRRATARPAAAAAAGLTIPKCQGSWSLPIADVTTKESLKGGVSWQVGLSKKRNASMGTVNFRTQIFADGHEVAGTGTQKQKWNYKFHGTVPRTFVRADNKKKFTLPQGSVVSFFWTWKSVAKPGLEGYRYTICQFQP